MRRASGLGREVAASVGASARLLPHLPELLADLSALGSSPRLVVAMLKRAGVKPRARVLDLACGKGAVGIALARGLSARVTGVDGFGAFLDAARDAATDAGVGALCEWVEGDVRRYRSRGDGFDVSMMLGLFGLEEALPILRRHTRAGGLYVVDDATCGDRDEPEVGLSRALAESIITAEGDTIVELRRQTPSEARRRGAVLYRRLRVRAMGLRRANPSLARGLDRFLADQRRANRMLAGPLRSTIWLVKRSADAPD